MIAAVGACVWKKDRTKKGKAKEWEARFVRWTRNVQQCLGLAAQEHGCFVPMGVVLHVEDGGLRVKAEEVDRFVDEGFALRHRGGLHIYPRRRPMRSRIQPD